MRASSQRREPLYNPFDHLIAARIQSAASNLSAQRPTTDRKQKPVERQSDSAKSRQHTTATKRQKTDHPGSGHIGTSEEGADLLNAQRFKGEVSAWQQDESIDDFLKRLPIAEPATAKVGPWLWVCSPQITRARKARCDEADVSGFLHASRRLLEAFREQKTKIESANADKAPTTISRKLAPYRHRLEEDLLQSAVDHATTCGKWMLFPNATDLPRYWRSVAEATSQGKLGPGSKVATPGPSGVKDATLICIYTYDFADLDDVKRVLDQLLQLGLCSRDGKPIYYKSDAYTYLDISSENEYDLRASLFSSKDILTNNPKVFKEGPLARLRKGDSATDSFFNL